MLFFKASPTPLLAAGHTLDKGQEGKQEALDVWEGEDSEAARRTDAPPLATEAARTWLSIPGDKDHE